LTLLVALGVVFAATGCSVSFGDGSEDAAGGARVPPLVQDGRATIDLRTKPTRESLGFRQGSTSAFYDREIGSDGIRVTLLLPGGKSAEVVAYSISSVAMPDPLNPNPPADRTNLPPSQTILNARFPSPEAAKAALDQQADALGLDREQLSQAGAQPGVIGGTVLDGIRQDWLNVQADVRTDDNAGEVLVNYLVSYDAETLPPRA
jgi:hypothetical protein